MFRSLQWAKRIQQGSNFGGFDVCAAVRSTFGQERVTLQRVRGAVERAGNAARAVPHLGNVMRFLRHPVTDLGLNRTSLVVTVWNCVAEFDKSYRTTGNHMGFEQGFRTIMGHASEFFGGLQGADLGAQLGGLLGVAGGPVGVALGAAVGGGLGAVFGPGVGRLLFNAAQQIVGGVDLGGTLHFEDFLPTMTDIVIDPAENVAMAISRSNQAKAVAEKVSVRDWAVLLKVEYFNRGQASFSLDPADPSDPFGPFQKKVFRPEWLAGTDVGDTMCNADILLKRLSLGLEDPGLARWQSTLDFPQHGEGPSTHRLWIVPVRASVKRIRVGHATMLQPGEVKMGICACRMVVDRTSPTGLRDDVVTAPMDPAVLFARMCTARMPELVGRYPELQKLEAFYKALFWIRAMKTHTTATVDAQWVSLFADPHFVVAGKVATMRNERHYGTFRRQVVGGCELGTHLDLEIVDVEPTGDEVIRLQGVLRSAREQLGRGAPLCYTLGRRLDGAQEECDAQVWAALNELANGADGTTVEITLPRPSAEEIGTAVSLPFVRSVEMNCCCCGMPLVGPGADPHRFQTFLGFPLCSLLHPERAGTKLFGPTFRLTPMSTCAGCGLPIAADERATFTVQSTDAPVTDYHMDCVPPEMLQAAFERREREEQLLMELYAQLAEAERLAAQALEGGCRLGGGPRVEMYSTGNELVDEQTATMASLAEDSQNHGEEILEPAEIDEDLQLALQASLQQNADEHAEEDTELMAAIAISLAGAP